MCHAPLRAPYDAGDVQAMVGKLFAGRVVYHDGTAELAPGVTVHRVGGHTRGLQVVRAHTRRGWVVLASDAAHFYANWLERRPFPIVENVAAYLDAFATIEALADSPQHVIPGHDPKVLSLYPAASAGIVDAVRVDLDPRS
jgi:glyoxylase-like metal-dependent hydrolase (beta-lactamase superfamily II)